MSPQQQNQTMQLDTTSLPPTTPPPGPTSPQVEKDNARAMSSTDSWKPAIERRTSYAQEDQKRERQMSDIGQVKTGPGFSERSG